MTPDDRDCIAVDTIEVSRAEFQGRNHMSENDLIPIDIKKIAITNVTCVIVVGDTEREFPIYIEPGIGAVIWAAGVTLLGFFLGRIEFIKANIDAVLVVIVLVSVVPMVIEAWLHRRRAAAEVTEP